MKWNDDAFTIRRYIGIGGLLASAVGLALIMRFTVAYLGDTTEPRVNTLNVGYADVAIVENDGNGFSEPSELVMLNPNINKKVQVQNNGTVPAFVRVYAEFSDSELAAKAKVKYGTGTYSWEDFKRRLNYSNQDFDGEGSALASSKWRYVPSDIEGLGGYFYYTASLPAYKPAGETTSAQYFKTDPLFDGVVIDYKKYNENSEVQDSSNIDRIQPLEMIIYSELVQVIDTGRSSVTTTFVGEDGQPVGEDTVQSSRYGYDFSADVLGNKVEWEDAWKRFLKLETDREQSETVKKTDEDNDGD